MKQISDLKHSGKSWNARAVAGQKVEDFIADPAHALEGMTADQNTAALTAIHGKCTEAVKAADTKPPVEPAAKPVKGKA